MSNKKNLRRISVLVTAQTAFNLTKLAEGENLTEGQLIDEMVQKKLFTNKVWKNANARLRKDKSKPFTQVWSEALGEELGRRRNGGSKK
ncbi:MAG: hypothetical protein RR365_00555 [Bacteroides sp.]